VVLSDGFRQHGDAKDGPLKPGEVGIVVTEGNRYEVSRGR
jgi:hypothetical protein